MNSVFSIKYSCFLLLNIILAVSCSSSEVPLYDISINETKFKVEIAQTVKERQQGLMYRDSLPDNQGMLFIFENEQKMSFWMKNTKIPLSIAYISKSGIIKEIHNMEPLSQKAVQSTHTVLYALEVNLGFFEKKGIRVGDKVYFSF